MAVRLINTAAHNGTDRLKKIRTVAGILLIGEEGTTLHSELRREPLPQVIGETALEGVEVLAQGRGTLLR